MLNYSNRTFKIVYILVFFCSLNSSKAQENWSPEHVFYGKGGKLTYTPDEQGNTIPDFSNVGYKYGDAPIPNIATVIEVSPVEGDDGAVIQAALDSLYSLSPDENGFRGAVLLKSGTYQISGQIKISKSGIVLRGEGDTENGTLIIAEGTSTRDLINVDNDSRRTVFSESRKSIVEDYVPVGRKFVIISSTSGYEVGDDIVLYRPGTSKWIADIKMNQITPSSGTKQWSASSYSFYFERKITKISGDTLFFRNPVVMAMEKTYGGGAVYKYSFNRLQNIGIENICLKSAYTSETDENHSWSAIGIYSVQNCWVRNVTAWYFALSCAKLGSQSRLTTVLNCHSKEQKSIITGGRRYPFQTSGSLNLFKNCTSTEARHDYATGARVCGPNVFTRCTAANVYADIGPHHRWAMGTLYDIIETDGAINVQDRDDMGTGHGWAGANQVFWNCKGESSICQSPWVSAKNYNFGFVGNKASGARAGRPDGEWVGHNVPNIFPVSLYEAQLKNRLSDSTIFSAVSQLIQVNDTTYKMQFTLPLDTAKIKSENFQLTSPDKIKDSHLTIRLFDDYSVTISSANFKNLSNSTIKITSDKITSTDGRTLKGIKTALFKVEDKRPVITGSSKIADNIDDFVEASSNKEGTIYFVKYGLNISTQAELDSLVKANLGRKVEISVADTTIQIFTKGLPGDYYQYYAVSTTGVVSLPSSTWVIVEEKGPVVGIEFNLVNDNFIAYQSNQHIIINPGNEKPFSLDVYTISGQLFYRGKNLAGIQYINSDGNRGVLVVRKFTESEITIVKLAAN